MRYSLCDFYNVSCFYYVSEYLNLDEGGAGSVKPEPRSPGFSHAPEQINGQSKKSKKHIQLLKTHTQVIGDFILVLNMTTMISYFGQPCQN